MFILSFVDYLIGTCICLCFWIYYIFEERKLPLILRLPLIIASVFFAEPWIFFAFGILYKFPSLIEALFNWIFIIICFIAQWDLGSIGGYVEMGENIIGDMLAIPLFAGSFYVTYLLVVATCDDIGDTKTKIEVSFYEIVASLELASLMIYRYVFAGTEGIETYDMIVLSIIIIVCTIISLFFTCKILVNL